MAASSGCRKGEKLHAGATFGHSSEAAAFFKANPRGLGDKSLAPRVMRSGRTEHIPDRSRDPEFSFPGLAMPDAMLGVPMFRNGGIEGVFTLSRARASAFSTRQIELVRSFADQAVIAIENARLFNEVQAKTRDLEESLTQQTATAEMLQVISRSAFDLETIFQTLVTTAVDLCKASSGTLCVRDGEVFRYRGVAGTRSERRLSALSRRSSPRRADPGDDRGARYSVSSGRADTRYPGRRGLRCAARRLWQPRARLARRAAARQGGRRGRHCAHARSAGAL